jgi:hypothetical protein
MGLNEGGSLYLVNQLSCRFKTIANINRDVTGIRFENKQVNDQNNGKLYCTQGTFTVFNRVFTTDELYNNDEHQKVKDDYVGRIVVSTGTIDTADSGVN